MAKNVPGYTSGVDMRMTQSSMPTLDRHEESHSGPIREQRRSRGEERI